MIAIEPLTQAHMARFPVPGLPLDLWTDKAVAVVKDGEVLGICGARLDGDTAYAGMIVTDELREHPIFLCKTVLYGIEGLRQMGVKYLRVQAETNTSARWLERMGFVAEKRRDQRTGWWVKCLA